MGYPINIAVDIGGTGARLALSARGGIQNIHYAKPDSLPALINAISRLAGGKGPDALAIAAPGRVRDKKVIDCYSARWLEGDPARVIRRELALREDKIQLINDGEAHALALRKRSNIKFGAIHLAVGTGLGFGVIDENGKILRSLSGDNWELSDIRLITRSPENEVWRLLGARGFKEQQERGDTDGYQYYGWRLGSLASQLALIFRPRTIGLSGGIVRHHWRRIQGGFRYELEKRIGSLKHVMPVPEVIVLDDDEDAALTGLTALF
ncbi:MAG: ROK family protein [Gracilibacteraceae bacterium]|jgi:glucokinase|nr:ROK family protein [Gracilibacteraceae bacterium]